MHIYAVEYKMSCFVRVINNFSSSNLKNQFLDSLLKSTFKKRGFQGNVIFLSEIVYFLDAVNLTARLMFHRRREWLKDKKSINISKKDHLDQGE